MSINTVLFSIAIAVLLFLILLKYGVVMVKWLPFTIILLGMLVLVEIIKYIIENIKVTIEEKLK